MITGRNAVRPGEVYPLRSRDVRHGSDEVVAAFRVHYRLHGQPENQHKVTDLMWEHEAREFADMMAKSGVTLVSGPGRPGGIERVRGYNNQPYEDAHAKWARERAERVERERLAEEERKFDAARRDTERLASEWDFMQRVSQDGLAAAEIVTEWIGKLAAFASDKQEELFNLWKRELAHQAEKRAERKQEVTS